jgi:DNA repair exonuclease SbcCD ATPase subunit
MTNPFEMIQPWIPTVLEAIKKEIKLEHLPVSGAFVKAHFGHRPLNRLKIEEIFLAYEKALLEGDSSLAEWIINRWVFRHGDIYSHFADRLSAIHVDFAHLKGLTDEQSERVLQGSVERFGALLVYLFSVLNGVVFSESVFVRLRQAAEEEEAARKKEEAQSMGQKTLEQEVARYQREIARWQEKYESKVAGMTKKYTTDIEALKKQIRSLQQKILSMGA